MAATQEGDQTQLNPNLSNGDDDSVDSKESATFQNAKSDCGFADSFHDALMAAGQVVHGVFGEPPKVVSMVMRETGDFVKDTALALHDFGQADASVVREETSELIKMMTSKEESHEEEEENVPSP
ncbi:hypothetical protein MHU86_10157 [Fragilaria crotonensis]|nr:hypothetical protein MHU86_10157 [Fragilaria crotonensis]